MYVLTIDSRYVSGAEGLCELMPEPAGAADRDQRTQCWERHYTARVVDMLKDQFGDLRQSQGVGCDRVGL